MPFAERFLGRPDPVGFTAEMLRKFLDLRVEEGLNLDYKNISVLENPDKVAQVIVAFANAEGGLLILGVDESKESTGENGAVRLYPGQITWGPKKLQRESVESRLTMRVHPWVQGTRIHPIRNDRGEAVFLIDVPASPRPPHQAPDKKYYLRYNFQNLPMDHYQVQALFYRRLRPNLKPSLEILHAANDGKKIKVRIGLSNDGGAIAKQPLFFGEFINCLSIKAVEKRLFFGVRKHEFEGNRFVISSQSPINAVHPGLVDYLGTIEIDYDTSFEVSILVAAEEMPTKQYVTGLESKYIQKLDHDFDKAPIDLQVLSPEDQPDQETFEKLLRQFGVEPDEFYKAIAEIVAKSRPWMADDSAAPSQSGQAPP